MCIRDRKGCVCSLSPSSVVWFGSSSCSLVLLGALRVVWLCVVSLLSFCWMQWVGRIVWLCPLLPFVIFSILAAGLVAAVCCLWVWWARVCHLPWSMALSISRWLHWQLWLSWRCFLQVCRIGPFCTIPPLIKLPTSVKRQIAAFYFDQWWCWFFACCRLFVWAMSVYLCWCKLSILLLSCVWVVGLVSASHEGMLHQDARGR